MEYESHALLTNTLRCMFIEFLTEMREKNLTLLSSRDEINEFLYHWIDVRSPYLIEILEEIYLESMEDLYGESYVD